MVLSFWRMGVLAALGVTAVHGPALAHHPMGGQTPQTFVQGLLSGLGHPIIGVDHLAAIVGVAILAAIAGRGLAPILSFSAAMMLGVVLHLGDFDLPGGELLVGLTTLAIGGLVALRRTIGSASTAILFTIAGLVHGYALGETIVGAEPTPIIAYLLGLFAIQTAIGAATYRVVRRLADWPPRRAGLAAAGALVALAGGVATAAAAGL